MYFRKSQNIYQAQQLTSMFLPLSHAVVVKAMAPEPDWPSLRRPWASHGTSMSSLFSLCDGAMVVSAPSHRDGQ